MGCVDYDAMMDSLTEEQFRTWWAYDLFVEPFELSRMDRRFGLLACAVETMLCGDSSMQPSDFDLSYREIEEESEPEAEDWQVMKAKMEMVGMRFNAAQEV